MNAHLAAGIRAAVRAAGFTTPVVASGQDPTPSSRRRRSCARSDADLVGMARALLADPDLPRKWRAGADARRAHVRLLPVLRGGGPAPPAGHLHAVAEGPGGPRSRVTPSLARRSSRARADESRKRAEERGVIPVTK